MNKKKADTTVRINELMNKDSLTGNEQLELDEYLNFFVYAKTLNKEDKEMDDEVNAMTTFGEIKNHHIEFTPPPSSSQNDDDLTDAQFFVKYGYNRDL
jgi:hypothetical protein